VTRTFSRRGALGAFGTVSLGALLGACGSSGRDATVSTTDGGTATVEPRATGTPSGELFDASASCGVTVEQTEGPYYFDADAIRSDITEDRDGTPLRLAIRVRDAGSCEPLENAVVDIWHCDAAGEYSGFESAVGGPGGGDRSDDATYLRGAQVTDTDGVVQFRTIYPGWYRGRTVHVHAKVHLDRQTLLTSQLYFDDQVTARVHANAPYGGAPEMGNADDGIYDESLELTLREDGDGWLGVMTFDVERA